MFYVNTPLLAILCDGGHIDSEIYERSLKSMFPNDSLLFGIATRVEKTLHVLAGHLHVMKSDNAIYISSDFVSRPVRRKIFHLICSNLMLKEGRYQALRIILLIAEHIVTEIITLLQGNSVSSKLWSKVRDRGCQFLGPGSIQIRILD